MTAGAWPSRALGYLFSEIIRLLQLFRHGRPVHPHGLSLVGRIVREAAPAPASGIAWLDEPGECRVAARVSRGLGLPSALPDIIGLALRVQEPEASFDILLASTGRSPVVRFLVLLQRGIERSTLGSLMPYKGTTGPVLLSARTSAPHHLPADLEGLEHALAGEIWRLDLYWARPLGHWTRFGSLQLQLDPLHQAEGIRFDPVLNPPRGARTYEWARNLRQRAYLLARRRPVAGQ